MAVTVTFFDVDSAKHADATTIRVTDAGTLLVGVEGGALTVTDMGAVTSQANAQHIYSAGSWRSAHVDEEPDPYESWGVLVRCLTELKDAYRDALEEARRRKEAS